jgi:hypothetical protein
MKNEHADKLINEGEIYLSNLSSFTKNSFGGKIDDSTEGKITIENFYNHYIGRVKDTEGLIPMLNQPYSLVELNRAELSSTFENPDSLVFCTTSFLFSDSLSWAIKENKETCVMILDSTLFYNEIENALGTQYHGIPPTSCEYNKNINGILREINPDKHSHTNKYLSNQHYISFTKPKNYEEQREVRTVFFKKDNITRASEGELLPISLNINTVNIYIKIEFQNADKRILLNEKAGQIQIKINKKNGEPSLFEIKKPKKLFTPVFMKPLNILGFWHPLGENELYSGFKPTNCSAIGGEIPLFCGNKINNIKSIEILTNS